MRDESRFERRVGQLIGAYADRAPIDVDPAAMARFVAAGERVRTVRPLFVPSHVGLGFGVLVIALLTVIIGGAIAVGRPFEHDRDPNVPDDFLVGPFIGLPPAGAAPSRPEIGKLVLEASGGCTSSGSFCFVWIYEDGRLIWALKTEPCRSGRTSAPRDCSSSASLRPASSAWYPRSRPLEGAAEPIRTSRSCVPRRFPGRRRSEIRIRAGSIAPGGSRRARGMIPRSGASFRRRSALASSRRTSSA